MTPTRPTTLAAACLLGLAATVLTTPAFAASTPDTVVWTAPAGADYARQVSEAWTPQRIADARPMPAPEVASNGTPVTVGPPGRVDPAPSRAGLIAPTINGDGKAARWVDPSDPRFYESPASTTGILMFHNPLDGGDWMCSASVVNSEAKNMVITAAHCLMKKKTWMTDVVFFPDYHQGLEPYKSWVPQLMVAPGEWYDKNNHDFDWGFVIMRPNASGQRLANVTGSQGIAWNYPVDKPMWVFGYPAEPPFDGQTLWYCHEQAWRDGLDKDNMGVMCNFTGGSSGGPWIMGDTPAWAWVNGVTSYSYDHGAIYSSYFGDRLAQTYQSYRNQGA